MQHKAVLNVPPVCGDFTIAAFNLSRETPLPTVWVLWDTEHVGALRYTIHINLDGTALITRQGKTHTYQWLTQHEG